MNYDCGFTKEENWFRYRAVAIIIEDDCVLFAGNEKDAYPAFLKDKLGNMKNEMEHIVTHEWCVEWEGEMSVNEKKPEIWDAYYPDGTIADVDLVRGEPIPY